MQQYLQQFEKDLKPVGPAWVAQLRNRGMERFNALGFPTVRQEDWKYTNVQPLADSEFHFVPEPDSKGLDISHMRELSFGAPQGIHLTFVNGRFFPELSCLKRLPEGVVAGSLMDYLQNRPDLVEPHLASQVVPDAHGFAALNTAFLNDGAFLLIPKGMVVETPIEILHLSKPNGTATVSYPRLLVVAEAGSQFHLLEGYSGDLEKNYFVNTVTEIILKENAIVEHYKIQDESVRSYHISATGVRQGRNSRYTSHSISLGGALTRNDLSTVLDAEGAEAILNGLYVATDRQHVDNHTNIDHAKPHCTSSELYKGILSGKAQGVFNGRILVRADAQKTNSRQTNKNLLLSDEAIVNTKPLLEIFANDVKCNHGATIGRLDENQIFYLRSRGIEKSLARDLLTYAFASELLHLIKIQPIRSKLERHFFEELHIGSVPREGL